jgi:hypothetical protein
MTESSRETEQASVLIQPTAMAASIKPPEIVAGAPGIFGDLEALKLSLADAGLAGSTELLMRVPVRKPAKHEYFRVRAGEENCFTTVIFEDREARENYFVTPAMIPLLRAGGDVAVVSLVQFMSKQKVLGVFPLKLATDSNVQNGWQDTAMQAAQMAKSRWVRMQADMALSGYRVFTATGNLGEPVWPDATFNELLDIAFKDRVIASEDHPVFNKLLGRL